MVHSLRFTVHGLLFLSLILILFLSCSGGLQAEFPAPDFSVEDIFTGEEIHLADLKGSPLLIYFLSSW